MAFKGALVKKSADQTAANYTSATAISFDTEIYDTDSWHDTVTNNTRMTVPSGVTHVRITGQVALSSLTSSSTHTLQIFKNGSALSPEVFQRENANTTAPYVPIRSSILVVSPGDYLEMNLTVSSDTSITVEQEGTWLQIEEVPNPQVAYSGALVKKSVDQTAANYTSATALTFDTDVNDVGGWHDTGSNTSRMTVPSGVSRVRLTGQVGFSSFAFGANYRVEIYKNGTVMSPACAHSGQTGSLAPGHFAFSYVDSCSPGDYYELFLTAADSSMTIEEERTWFAIEKVE